MVWALLDGLGSVHTVGNMTSLPPQDLIPWYGEDIARAITDPNGGPVWMIDRFGRIKNWGQTAIQDTL